MHRSLSRRGPVLINTEHRKVTGTDQSELEKECRDITITEKRWEELVTQSRALEVKKMAVSLGISEKGSKFDVAFRIRQCSTGAHAGIF